MMIAVITMLVLALRPQEQQLGFVRACRDRSTQGANSHEVNSQQADV